jgi:putative membrane protein
MRWWGVFWRGMAMGTADLVPGVSGGTVALMTGVYDRLLTALSRADAHALQLLGKRHWGALWAYVDATFVLVLAAGMATAIVSFAGLIDWFLREQPLLLWSFFFGLVVTSIPFLWQRESVSARAGHLLLLSSGCVLALAIAVAPSSTLLTGYGGVFIAGAIAICAMILPGISGSFLLLLLGMYEPIIQAINEVDLATLGTFALGAMGGLLAFSKLLHRWLQVARLPTMAFLIGILIGSLAKLWPWQLTDEISGERSQGLWQSGLVGPEAYAVAVGDPMVIACVLSAGLGGAIILVSHYWYVRRQSHGDNG